MRHESRSDRGRNQAAGPVDERSAVHRLLKLVADTVASRLTNPEVQSRRTEGPGIPPPSKAGSTTSVPILPPPTKPAEAIGSAENGQPLG